MKQQIITELKLSMLLEYDDAHTQDYERSLQKRIEELEKMHYFIDKSYNFIEDFI